MYKSFCVKLKQVYMQYVILNTSVSNYDYKEKWDHRSMSFNSLWL